MGKNNGLSDAQKEILREAEFAFKHLTENELSTFIDPTFDTAAMGDEKLLEFLELTNILYRAGDQLIADKQYDLVFLAELRNRMPEHPYLHTVEPEPLAEAKTVELPFRMLSTEKAYDFVAIDRWAMRVHKAAKELGIDFTTLVFRATPKLDGFAAYDDGQKLYTRGDGRRGTDISRVFARGLAVVADGPRGLGPGEIVVSRSYFMASLADMFENSRNFQASLIKEKDLEPPAAEAIRAKKAVFHPFSLLPNWQGTWLELSAGFDTIIDQLWQKTDYDVDGIVIEIVDEQLKEFLGATRHHHRWQIAYKRNTATAEVEVLRVVAQTSRSGRVNPVAEIEPTRLSGALIKRVTAHHYNMVRQNGIGPGAKIRLSRSGEVIPKIEEVLVPADPELPETCPSCGAPLVWENDFLQCINNMNCPAQITNSIEHFFKILGNNDGFGPASIGKIYAGGITTIPAIYRLQEADFVALGFGPKQAENMVAQLQRSQTELIEDWRFLAAFGIYRMGMGNCEKLLSFFPLERVFTLTREDVVSIKGFSEKIADAMLAGLAASAPLLGELYALGFNLIRTPQDLGEEGTGNGPLVGKLLVFTGTMQTGSRDEMKQQAKLLGAKIGDAITGKTDMLVCGEKVGATKLKKAKELGVQVLSEVEYLALIK